MPLTWRADWPDCKPVESLVHRGTDIELRPTWYINGAAAATNGWTFTTYVQTNAVGQWFGPLPGAAFSHTNDVGAAFYSVMVRAQGADGGVNYTAFARFRMLDSPGFTPGELPLPAKVIDFADVTVLNAPWPDASITNGFVAATTATNIAEAAAASATNALDVSLSSRMSQASQNSTNYTDSAIAAATNDLAGIRAQLDAATTTNAQQQSAIAGLQAAQTNSATKADATLTPVYGGNGERFSAWMIVPATFQGFPISLNEYITEEDEGDRWEPRADNESLGERKGFANSVHLEWQAGDDASLNITATRTENPVIGYTLGDQTNKVLSSTNDLARASDIAATNPNFSNAVLQVGVGIDTNTVAAINALVEAGDELPIGGATTVGALLLALAAAVATLKKSKADSAALRYDIPAEPTYNALYGDSSVSPMIVYSDCELADRTANHLIITDLLDELRLTFPAAVSGKVRDFGLRVEVGDGTAALTAPALVPPAGVTLENADGAIPALADGTATAKGVTLLCFSETAPGVFLVKGEQVKEA